MSQARMRVPQEKQEANGGTATHSTRRRRRGGPTASSSSATAAAAATGRQPTSLLQHTTSTGGRAPSTGGVSGGAGGRGGGGGGRGGGSRKLWEDYPTPTEYSAPKAAAAAAAVTSAGRGHASPPAVAQLSKDEGGGGRRKGGAGVRRAAVAPAAGNGFGGGGGGGAGRGVVHPGMLESEFLAATGQANAGAEGGAVLSSLSLEEVPYDRDLRWCNTASDSRPRPKMDPSGGVFGRVGTAITQDTGDYERLDRHYQELWKDRGGNGVRSASRPSGRVRKVHGAGGGRANNALPAGVATIAAALRRDGRGDGAAAGRREGVGGRGGRGGGVGGSPSSSRDAAGAAAAEAGRGGGGGGGGGERGSAGHRNRPQRANGANKVLVGRPAGGGRANGVQHSSPSADRVPQKTSPGPGPGYHAQGAPAAVAVQPRGGGAGGPLPAQALNNVRGWSEGRDHQQHREKNGGGGGGRSSHPLGTWAMEPSGLLPGTAVAAAVINGGGRVGVGVGTPPLVPAMPSQFVQSFPPESPEYLSDLANVLSPTPPPPYAGQLHNHQQQQQPKAVTPPLGSARGGGDLFAGAGGGGGGLTPKQEGNGAALSPFLSPSLSPSPRQSTMLADPSLDVDIQDICADPDLNADAPAFVPGGY